MTDGDPWSVKHHWKSEAKEYHQLSPVRAIPKAIKRSQQKVSARKIQESSRVSVICYVAEKALQLSVSNATLNRAYLPLSSSLYTYMYVIHPLSTPFNIFTRSSNSAQLPQIIQFSKIRNVCPYFQIKCSYY